MAKIITSLAAGVNVSNSIIAAMFRYYGKFVNIANASDSSSWVEN